MARSTQEIESQIVNTVQADEVLQPVLTSNSAVAIWRRWCAIFAFCINVVEKLWDAFKAEILEILSKQRKFTLRWYAEKALAFQLGFPTLPDSDEFDNTAYSEAQIEASKVVKYVAVTEEERPGFKMFLRMKLAGTNGTNLVTLPAATVTAVKSYFNTKAKAAGVKMVFESLDADKITMEVDVYYDPTILDANGARLDGSASAPAKDAIVKYLENLPFNGLYVLASHVDYIQKVEGVVIPVIKQCLTTYGLLPFAPVNVEYQPDAGWMRFEDENTDLTINYIPHDAIQY
jgi:hypothetical protein